MSPRLININLFRLCRLIHLSTCITYTVRCVDTKKRTGKKNNYVVSAYDGINFVHNTSALAVWMLQVVGINKILVLTGNTRFNWIATNNASPARDEKSTDMGALDGQSSSTIGCV